MLDIIVAIPHPSPEQIIISIELFLLLYPLRLVQKAFESQADKEAKQLKRRFLKHHVHHRHTARFKDCNDGNCDLLA